MPLSVFIIIVIVWLALIPSAYAGLIGAPYLPTRRPVIRQAFKQLGIGEGDTVVDLGAGDGTVLVAARQAGARAFGYELSPIMWLVSWARLRGGVFFANFYKKQLPEETTVVFTFLMPRTMKRAQRYLASQHLPKGKYLLSYTFPLPQEVPPLNIIRDKQCGPIYVYDLQELNSSGIRD